MIPAGLTLIAQLAQMDSTTKDQVQKQSLYRTSYINAQVYNLGKLGENYTGGNDGWLSE